jgi:hypothetical protein
LADPQSQTTGSTVPMFDWESARVVGQEPEFDIASARPLSEVAEDPSYLMSREQLRAYKAQVKEDESAVSDFLAGIPSIVPGIIGIGSGTIGEAGQQIAQNWYRPDKLLAAFTANVNESQRINALNYAKLFDYVYRNVRDYGISMARDQAAKNVIAEQLRQNNRLTGDAGQDAASITVEFNAAKERGEFPRSEQDVDEDDERDYQDYVRRWSFDSSLANITNISVAGAPATVPASQWGGRNIITGEYVSPGQFTPQALAIGTDPGNVLAFGAGSLAKVAALRRAGILLGKGLGPIGRGLSSGGAFVARQADRISNRVQLATGGQIGAGGKIVGGLTPEMQTYGGGAAATGLAYMTGGDSVLDQAVTGTLALVPSLRMAGGILRSAGSTANAGWIISREAGAGGMSVRQAEAAAKLGANAAIPKRYSRFMTGEAKTAADSTLRRVAQDEANPRLLRSLAQFGDNVGVTSVFRATDDAVGGALGGAVVSTPFALAMEEPEQAGAVIGGGLLFGAAGGIVGGKLTRMAEMQDASIARMLVDAEASGGNAAAFATMPHSDLVGMAGMQAFSRGKLKFVPLTTSEYRVNLDVQRQGGENTAGFYVERAMDGTAKVFINAGEPSKVAGEVVKVRTRKDGGKVIEVRGEDGQSNFTYVPNASRLLVKQGDVVGVGTPLTRSTPAKLSVPEEIAHAIFSSNVMDGLPRDEMRNYVNQRYKTDGISARGREYVATTVDSEIAAGMHGAADAVDEAMRERLIQERFEEYGRGSIEKGDDPLDWARDEVAAASLRAATQGIDLTRLRNQSNFSRLAEQVVASSAQALRVFGVDVDRMGRVVDPAATFRYNPVFADPAMRRMVTKYMRDYDQWLAGMEDAGRKDRRGVRVAPSGKAEDMANSQHTVLREVKDANGNGTGVFENDVLVRGTDGKVRTKEQSDIDKTEISRAAQIKSLYNAGKKVPTASTEFGKRVVNGREIVGGPTLPPQFDLFTQFPQWIREFARQLESGRANGKTWTADYNAIGTGASGRYRVTNLGNIEAILREVAFVGWQITKKDHLLATVFDMNAFRASAKRAIDNGELGEFGNNMDEVNATLLQYLDNHKNGRPGETIIGQTKKNILNGLIGTGTAKQSAANPFYADLNPRGSVRTFRVDRLNDLRDTGRTGYNFIYEAINANMMPDNNNRMPDAEPVPDGMPDAVDALTTDQLQRQYEENQGYLGLSTLGMREGRPVRGGAAQTRELLRRNEAISAELERRGVRSEDPQLQRALQRRGQAMPDAAPADFAQPSITDGPLEVEDSPLRISTRTPSAKAATENPLTSQLSIDTAAIANAGALAKTTGVIAQYPGIRFASKNPEGRAQEFIRFAADNLLWLHDQVPADIRPRSSLWYDGARNISVRWSGEYGIPRQGNAAAIAALSPQKDWYMNVSLARRVLEMVTKNQDRVFGDAEMQWAKQRMKQAAPIQKMLAGIKGKRFADMTTYEKAVFSRAFDEINNPRGYEILSPEGEFIGPATNKDGSPSRVAWGDFNSIAKAVTVSEDPRAEVISRALGEEHKVRSFYNNIILPNYARFGDVTIDTHAVAGALLRPLAGSDTPVLHNFGGSGAGGSAITGHSGTYGLYADAYRLAASERGILPRQMQSITWEAVRGLFSPEWKTASNKALVDKVWTQYKKGEIDINETRKQISDSAGGIAAPSWYRPNP